MKTVILAGGFGTRISEETALKPKPMVEIGGKPILWHIMKMYSSFGLTDFIVCLGYKGYVIKEYFANYFLHNADVTFHLAEDRVVVHDSFSEKWSVTLVDTGLNTMTGGRLKRIKAYLTEDENFCMTYGDGLSDVNISQLLEFARSQNKLATVTAIQPAGRFGALELQGELVESFREKPQGQSWMSGGFFVLHPSVLDLVEGDKTSWEKEPMETLAAQGQLAAYRHGGFWQPVDTLRDKNYVEGTLGPGYGALEDLEKMSNLLSELRKLRFGYIPYQPAGQSPGDRRRFPWAATLLGLTWSLYQEDDEYDVLYITSNADLTHYRRLPRGRTKIAFEMVDSYLAIPRYHRDSLLRGTGKWLLKKHRFWEPFFDKTVLGMCRRANLVVCSNLEQKALMSAASQNIHCILDRIEELTPEHLPYFGEKERYHILWEGIGQTTLQFVEAAEALRSLARQTPVCIHFATDLTYKTLNVPLLRYNTKSTLAHILKGIPFTLSEWSPFTVKSMASHCDLAVIPLKLNDPLASNKPENKLLIMWQLGLPVIASATPAYTRVMGEYGGPSWTCNTQEDWEVHLASALDSHELRSLAAGRGSEYVAHHWSTEKHLERWTRALLTLLN